jgi:hypothetical protein
MDQPIITPAVDSTPLVCDMTGAPDTQDERVAEYGRLFARALVGRERTADGIRFRLRADDGVEAWVRDLAAREKACCPFMDFAILTVGAEVHYDMTVVDEPMARAILDEFYDLPELVAGGVKALEDRIAGLGFQVITDDSGTMAEVRPHGRAAGPDDPPL